MIEKVGELDNNKFKERRRRSRLNKAYSIEKDGVLIKIVYR